MSEAHDSVLGEPDGWTAYAYGPHATAAKRRGARIAPFIEGHGRTTMLARSDAVRRYCKKFGAAPRRVTPHEKCVPYWNGPAALAARFA